MSTSEPLQSVIQNSYKQPVFMMYVQLRKYLDF